MGLHSKDEPLYGIVGSEIVLKTTCGKFNDGMTETLPVNTLVFARGHWFYISSYTYLDGMALPWLIIMLPHKISPLMKTMTLLLT